MPIPSLQLQKKDQSHAEKQRVSKICFVIYSDCVQDLDYRILIVLSVGTRGCCKPMNNCRDWAFRNIGLEEWLLAFQLLIFENAEKRYVRNVCLGNPCLLWYQSLHSPPEAWGPWEPQYAPPVLHSCCIMPIPSLQLQKKDQSHAEKQRVSKILFRNIQWLCPRFGLQDIDCALSWDTWLLQTNERLSSIALEEWLPAFQLLIFENKSINAEKRYVRNVCLGNPCLLWYQSFHSPTEACRSLGAAVRSTSSAFLLHHAHPFVAAAEKRPVSCREAEGLVTELWSPRIVAIYWLFLYDCCKGRF